MEHPLGEVWSTFVPECQAIDHTAHACDFASEAVVERGSDA